VNDLSDAADENAELLDVDEPENDREDRGAGNRHGVEESHELRRRRIRVRHPQPLLHSDQDEQHAEHRDDRPGHRRAPAARTRVISGGQQGHRPDDGENAGERGIECDRLRQASLGHEQRARDQDRQWRQCAQERQREQLGKQPTHNVLRRSVGWTSRYRAELYQPPLATPKPTHRTA
jgi:hypothetical protein